MMVNVRGCIHNQSMCHGLANINFYLPSKIQVLQIHSLLSNPCRKCLHQGVTLIFHILFAHQNEEHGIWGTRLYAYICKTINKTGSLIELLCLDENEQQHTAGCTRSPESWYRSAHQSKRSLSTSLVDRNRCIIWSPGCRKWLPSPRVTRKRQTTKGGGGFFRLVGSSSSATPPATSRSSFPRQHQKLFG